MRAWFAGGTASLRAPAAFLDRDGTLNRNRPGEYITRPEQLSLYARVPAGLKILSAKGYRLIVITNQSAIARGYMTAAEAGAINLRLVEVLRREGIVLDGIYFCPHAPADKCGCRKPAAGLIREAAADRSIDMRRSFVAGDKDCDMRLARRAGLKGYLVMTGGGRAAAAGRTVPGFRDLLSLALAVPDLSRSV